jgi:ElaB/YqjD/DUF883 family membrane-anchored ribosome-binding protein
MSSHKHTTPTPAQVADAALAASHTALDDAGTLAREGIAKARQASQALRERASHASEATVSYIQHEPVKAVLIAAAVGAAGAALVGWLNRPR